MYAANQQVTVFPMGLRGSREGLRARGHLQALGPWGEFEKMVFSLSKDKFCSCSLGLSKNFLRLSRVGVGFTAECSSCGVGRARVEKKFLVLATAWIGWKTQSVFPASETFGASTESTAMF